METPYATTQSHDSIKNTFCEINLASSIQEKLQELGFEQPTEIQKQAIPLLLEKITTNFHGQAQTGTGKTLAFGLPLLHRIEQEEPHTQGLVISPTRELALQIVESLMPFAEALDTKIVAVFGGVSIEDQIRKLNRGAHIVVGTPGRITDHLKRKTLDLSRLKTLVLDEADIMLDMGFREDIEAIMNFTPHDREIWLFSATVKSGIRDIISQYMPDVKTISASQTQVGAATTKQYYCVVPMHSRLDALCRFIECAPDFYGFIFCQTKMLTSEIADQLTRRGLIVGALHGDLSQTQRNSVIKKFKNRDYSIVVATDVAGRGIDIQDLTHVINYSLPEDFESYVHRTGRTGRAGKEGTAITFVNRSQLKDIKIIERKFKITVDALAVPTRDEIIQQRLTHVSAYANEKLTSEENAQIPGQAQRSIQSTLAHLTPEQWQELATCLIYEKHLKTAFEAKKDIPVYAEKDYKESNTQDLGEEIMFHVGLDDEISEQDFRTLLITKAGILEQQILKVRMIRRRTFVRVMPESANQVIDALRDETIAGRRLRGTIFKEERDRAPRQNGRFSNERTSRGYQGNSARRPSSREGRPSERRSSGEGRFTERRSSGEGRFTERRSSGEGRFTERRSNGEGRSTERRSNGEGRSTERRSSSEGRSTERNSTGFRPARRSGDRQERTTQSGRFEQSTGRFEEGRDRFEERTFKKTWNRDF